MQHIIAAVGQRRQSLEDGGQVGVACPQWNGTSAEPAIFNVDAADAVAIGRKLLVDPIAERATVPGVIIYSQEGVGALLQELRKGLRRERSFEMELHVVLFRRGQEHSKDGKRLEFFLFALDTRLVHERNHYPANAHNRAT